MVCFGRIIQLLAFFPHFLSKKRLVFNLSGTTTPKRSAGDHRARCQNSNLSLITIHCLSYLECGVVHTLIFFEQ